MRPVATWPCAGDGIPCRAATPATWSRIRAGHHPADGIPHERETPALREFADEYLRRCEPHWKPSGRKTVRIYLNARILPAFGKKPLDRIGPGGVTAWFDAAGETSPARPTAPWRSCAR